MTESSDGTVHDGTFIWADFGGQAFHTVTGNEFAVRATGGVRFVTRDGRPASGTPTRTTTIDGAGNVNIDPHGSIGFGSQTRQMLNLDAAQYGIGVQNFAFKFSIQLEF